MKMSMKIIQKSIIWKLHHYIKKKSKILKKLQQRAKDNFILEHTLEKKDVEIQTLVDNNIRLEQILQEKNDEIHKLQDNIHSHEIHTDLIQLKNTVEATLEKIHHDLMSEATSKKFRIYIDELLFHRDCYELVQEKDYDYYHNKVKRLEEEYHEHKEL